MHRLRCLFRGETVNYWNFQTELNVLLCQTIGGGLWTV